MNRFHSRTNVWVTLKVKNQSKISFWSLKWTVKMKSSSQNVFCCSSYDINIYNLCENCSFRSVCNYKNSSIDLMKQSVFPHCFITAWERAGRGVAFLEEFPAGCVLMSFSLEYGFWLSHLLVKMTNVAGSRSYHSPLIDVNSSSNLTAGQSIWLLSALCTLCKLLSARSQRSFVKEKHSLHFLHTSAYIHLSSYVSFILFHFWLWGLWNIKWT